jgi:hypothetical protein
MPSIDRPGGISLAFVWAGVLLFALHALSTLRHRHAPARLLIGLDGPFRIPVEGKREKGVGV